MLNLVQHLTNTRTYEALKSIDPETSSGPGVQGDKSTLFTIPSYLTFFYFNPSFHSSIIPTFQVGIEDKHSTLFNPASDLQPPGDDPAVLVGIALFEVF